jgi:hypothetical protein
MIALDIDGTLVDDDLALGERTRAAIGRAVHHGIRVSLLTGRMTYRPRSRSLGRGPSWYQGALAMTCHSRRRVGGSLPGRLWPWPGTGRGMVMGWTRQHLEADHRPTTPVGLSASLRTRRSASAPGDWIAPVHESAAARRRERVSRPPGSSSRSDVTVARLVF